MAEISCDGNRLEIVIRKDGNLIVRWVLEQGGLAKLVEEEGELRCWICGEVMKPHHLGAVHNPLKGSAFDFFVKCPNCSLYLTFGNPVDAKTAEKLRPFAGKFVDWWSLSDDKINDDKINQKVVERLKSWGYW